MASAEVSELRSLLIRDLYMRTSSLAGYETDHFWLPPPQREYSWMWGPLPVPWPAASRPIQDWTPTMVPSELTRHFRLSPPWQEHICTLTLLLLPVVSRHL